jgi:hypothetical protein
MTNNLQRLAVTALSLFLVTPGFAQTPPDSPPASKGTAADGSRPADGAIKGGSILPGETAGVPDDRAKSRCGDLLGTLRDQCLAQEKGSSAGGTRAPEADIVKPATPREAPPPQNPQLR